MNELRSRSGGKKLLARGSPLDRKKRLEAPARTRKRVMRIMEENLRESAQTTRSPSELKERKGKGDLHGEVALIVIMLYRIPKR